MFIQTEATPNPATLKFLPGRVVMPEGTFEAHASKMPAHPRLPTGYSPFQASPASSTATISSR